MDDMDDHHSERLLRVASVQVAGWVDRLAAVDGNADDVELIDLITQLERVKAACAAAQAVATVAFVASQTRNLTAVQLREEGTHRSIGAQIALARRYSPFRGGRHVGLAKALMHEMPNAFSALQSGVISEMAGDSAGSGNRLPVRRRPPDCRRGTGRANGCVG